MLENNAAYYARKYDYARLTGPATERRNWNLASNKPIAVPDPKAPANPALPSGIAPHSANSDYSAFRIFSVSSLLKAAEFRAWALGAGVRFKSLLGSWEGKQEPAFIVYEWEYVENTNLWRFAEDQEATLWIGPAYRNGRVHPSREASLHYKTVTHTALLFIDAPRDWALAQDGWTFDPTRNQFSILISSISALGNLFTAPAVTAPAGTSKGRSSESLFEEFGAASGLHVPNVEERP